MGRFARLVVLTSSILSTPVHAFLALAQIEESVVSAGRK